jgi:hypothetical protein
MQVTSFSAVESGKSYVGAPPAATSMEALPEPQAAAKFTTKKKLMIAAALGTVAVAAVGLGVAFGTPDESEVFRVTSPTTIGSWTLSAATRRWVDVKQALKS